MTEHASKLKRQRRKPKEATNANKGELAHGDYEARRSETFLKKYMRHVDNCCELSVHLAVRFCMPPSAGPADQ
jgi:hypothetical protein